MAWARVRPGDPTSPQYWVPAGDPRAQPGTTPLPGHSDPADGQQIVGQTPEEYATSHPGETAPATEPPPPTQQPVTYQSNQWGSTDPAYLRAQVDRVFAQYGRTPREDEYQQWVRYMTTPNVNGAGQPLNGWDPYWESRLQMHATGDYYGNGTTPGNAYGGSGSSSGSGYTDTTSGGGQVPYYPTGAPSYGPPPQSDADRQMAELVRQRILQLLNTPQTVDPQTLRDSPEMQAVYLQEQRAQERDRAALAERAAADGWSGSGAFEGGLNALAEKRGATEMTLMAQLATAYMERNREDLKNGIELAMNQGQFDQAQALQRELAALDAAIEREKIGASLSMDASDNALKRELGLGDLALRRYLGDEGIDYNYAELEYYGNRDAYDRLHPRT